jgi:hypothetical protein
MSNLSDPRLTFTVSRETVHATLAFLQQQGHKQHEGVVLWAGRLSDQGCSIEKALIPQQITSRLSYRIPDAETFRIIDDLHAAGLVVPVQVHSHPREAFHSPVDDERAFVQHEQGISIVIPNFGAITETAFFRDAKAYRLASDGSWQELTPQEVKRFRIT